MNNSLLSITNTFIDESSRMRHLLLSGVFKSFLLFVVAFQCMQTLNTQIDFLCTAHYKPQVVFNLNVSKENKTK